MSKKRKLRLKVRLQRLGYCILDKRDKYRYRHQRAKQGYSDYDVLDIQLWFVRTLRPMLENILAHLHSYPEGLTFEEWKSILEEMILLLKIIDWEDESFVREYMGIDANVFHTDTCDLVEAERKKARVQFMELFSKWFWKLSY